MEEERKSLVPDIPVVFGGVHPTALPEKVIRQKFVDIICIGEGEQAISELAENPKRTDIPNLWFKSKRKIIRNPVRPLITDLDSLPFADKSIFEKDISLKNAYLVAANRACPFNCTYCFNNYYNSLYKGQKIARQRSVEHVIDELKYAKKRYNIKSIYFIDDVFCFNMDYVREFFKEYNKHIKLPFKIISHPAVINNETIQLFKKSGCFNIEIGIQSMCQDTRRNILRRYESNDAIFKAIAILERNKIRYTLHHIFGLPNDNYDKLMEALNLYIKLKYCTKIDCYWLSYFPKTEIVEISKKMGLLNQKDVERIEDGKEPMYFEGGSVKNKSLRKMCKNFDIFFELIPTLPMPVRKFIYRTKMYHHFYLLPNISITLVNLLNAVKNKDTRTFDYIKHYWTHLLKN